MSERIDRLIAGGKLARHPASDQEVVGLWNNVLQAYQDACLAGQSLRGRLSDAYDAGRIAALAIVRCHDLRVTATNHHEITIAAAAFLSESTLATALNRLQATRPLRSELEYGWANVATPDEERRATDLAREILQEGVRHLRSGRPQIEQKIELPK